jgi:hypothetical protein
VDQRRDDGKPDRSPDEAAPADSLSHRHDANIDGTLWQTAERQPPVRDLGNGIHAAIGTAMGTAVQIPQSNTFMIVTRDGNVIVDTSGGAVAKAHRQALSKTSGGPTRADNLQFAICKSTNCKL